MSIDMKDKILSLKTKIALVEDSIGYLGKLDLDEVTYKDMLKDYNSELKYLKHELKEFQSLKRKTDEA